MPEPSEPGRRGWVTYDAPARVFVTFAIYSVFAFALLIYIGGWRAAPSAFFLWVFGVLMGSAAEDHGQRKERENLLKRAKLWPPRPRDGRCPEPAPPVNRAAPPPPAGRG